MLKSKSLLSVIVISGFMMTMSLTGCSWKPSEEDLKQKQALEQEIKSLEADVQKMKNEKSQLEKQIGERNAKLQQIEKTKQETQENLKKIGK